MRLQFGAMTPGQFARRLLGGLFPIAGNAYRRIFVNMPCVVEAAMRYIPPSAHVLDVGGGDGYVVNLLLEKRPDVRVTMTDIAPEIGSFVSLQNRSRVLFLPQTPVTAVEECFDVIMLADVVHHVPPEHREAFFADLSATAERCKCDRIIIKDIRPGSLRATLALWGDLYITGDRGVRQVGENDLHVPGFTVAADLMPDFPNYVRIFERA